MNIKNSTEKIRKKYDRVAGIYDFMERPMEAMLFRKSRIEMLRGLSGRDLGIKKNETE